MEGAGALSFHEQCAALPRAPPHPPSLAPLFRALRTMAPPSIALLFLPHVSCAERPRPPTRRYSTRVAPPSSALPCACPEEVDLAGGEGSSHQSMWRRGK